MGEDRGSWFPRHQFDWLQPNSNCLGKPFDAADHHTLPALMNPASNMVSMKGALPAYPSPEPPYSHVEQVNEPHGWFYCLPRFRQAFTPALNSGLMEKFSTTLCENDKKASTPKVESGCSQKRFLIFDQSGDQTTLIFSSGIGAPVPCVTSLGPKPIAVYDSKRENLGTHENLNINSGTVTVDQFGQHDEDDLQNDAHEDTDELNALLYSDDDSDFTDDDDVTSTGHSPSTMTDHNNQGWFNGIAEEVASSNGLPKKRKVLDGGYTETPALRDTASSMKPIRSHRFEHDAESICDAGTAQESELSNKRIRKEKIRETVNILQNIIPCGEGKDAIAVIDEAISYLKTLKVKAKALGLHAELERHDSGIKPPPSS